MSAVSKIKIQAKGYYLDHAENCSQDAPMRIETNLQTAHDGASLTDASVWIRIREDTPMSSGGCEAGIHLSVEQADQLLSALLDIIHYALPERRKL